jgi:hypothetical protein
MFALNKQRDEQKKFASELISDIYNRTLPNSISEKIEIYQKRMKFNQNIKYRIIKQSFLNYRLLNGYVTSNNKVIQSHILYYSVLDRFSKNNKIEFTNKNIHYLKKDNIILISLETANNLLNFNFQDIYNFNKNITINDEINLREKITNNKYSISTIVILANIENIKSSRLNFYIKFELYKDVRENLLIL